MKYFITIASILLFTACNQADNAVSESPANENTEANDPFTYESIEGTDVQKVTLKNRDGKIREQGFMLNGKRTGMWIVFERSDVFPQKIISYQNDMYNGPYYEFTERGQMTMKANYVNNKLDGYFARYKFSKEVVTANYINGKLNGEYREFDERKNFLTKIENYKDDQLHGKVEYYNEDGIVIMEYEYKNGKKLSGGMTNQ